jgi:uncharacterized membrane protein YciS (DUF1049 family)
MKVDRQFIAGCVWLGGGFALIAATYFFAPEYLLEVILGMFFISLILENTRLHKKLKELGHPQDLKSRAEAKAKAEAEAEAKYKS